MAVSVKFTDEEIEVLKKYYPIGDWDTLEELLPERTKNSIHKKAHRMGLKFDMSKKKGMTSEVANARKPWTKEEEDIIIANYSVRPVEDFLELLPNRTKAGVAQKAAKLGILSCYKVENLWSDEDLKFLKDNWEVESDFIIAKVLGKTREAVKDKRRNLELYRVGKYGENYKNLCNICRKNYPQWTEQSRDLYGHKCMFTGSDSYIVHHIQGVNAMVNEVLQFPQFEGFADIHMSELPKDKLKKFIECYGEVQGKYPLGACVREDIHKLYHALYGQFDNNVAQWDRFVENYNKGLYDDYEVFNKYACDGRMINKYKDKK